MVPFNNWPWGERLAAAVKQTGWPAPFGFSISFLFTAIASSGTSERFWFLAFITVLGRVPFLSLGEACAIVQQEESRRGAMLHTPPSDRSALIATLTPVIPGISVVGSYMIVLLVGEGVDVVVVVEVSCVLRLRPMFLSLQLLLLRLVLGSYHLSMLVVFLKGRCKLLGI
ncbi:hypothetical protein Acr_05g0012840 [Actinidia rufa]|uniref:Uncharacterized protein n=1 Tax=Actinidia rufa TaxID=165716 RepID=A0A7J0EMD5_9ERIC|nr:hypothetical protein Acr_05g0012840 [Actinidia rufa]